MSNLFLSRRPAGASAGLLLSLHLVLMGASGIASPVISDFAPDWGSPGTSVVIAGSDLDGTLEVLFGNGSALFTVLSPNLLQATVPLDATSSPINVSASTGVAVSFAEFRVSPRIQQFVPDSAPPGTVILIVGANFEGATAVQFQGTNAAFQVTSPTQLQARVPTGVTNGLISVTTPVGIAWSQGPFIVTGPEPFIDSFSPQSGAPGDTVTVQGVNFAGAQAVAFNGTNAVFFATSDTQIQVTVPAGASSGFISVTNDFGVGASLDPFVVTTAPVIDYFTPLAGPPGTSVVLNGANFLGATAVHFGAKNAVFDVTAPTQLHATVPPGESNASISITTPDGTGFSQRPFLGTSSPFITDFQPTNGAPGTLVAIDGGNFTGNLVVRCNGVSAQFSVNALTQLSMQVPPNATSGLITVSNNLGTARTAEPFLVRTGRPIITFFRPAAGGPRTVVVLEGVDLSQATSVKFNSTAASFSAVADTQIRTQVPDGATSGPISVSTPAGTFTTADRFVVAPVLTSFSPTNGPAGTTVTIRGDNFADLLSVRFREVEATPLTISSNQITVTVPDEATTGSINLITPAGIVAAPKPFGALPTIRQFAPLSGAPGTTVTITGTGFGDVLAVRFAGQNAAAGEVLSATQILAVVPDRASSGPISVVTISGTATSSRAFIAGAAADLALTQTQSSNSVLQSQVLTYTFNVTNQGPVTATGVVLSNLMPATVLPVSVTASQGTFLSTGANLRADLGTLPSGAGAQVVVGVLPTAAGSLTNIAAVAAREIDPELANNSAGATVAVLASSAILRAEALPANAIKISWPVTATGFVLQTSEALGAGAHWQMVTTAPIISADRATVTDSVTGRNRFYRLQRP